MSSHWTGASRVEVKHSIYVHGIGRQLIIPGPGYSDDWPLRVGFKDSILLNPLDDTPDQESFQSRLALCSRDIVDAIALTPKHSTFVIMMVNTRLGN